MQFHNSQSDATTAINVSPSEMKWNEMMCKREKQQQQYVSEKMNLNVI